MLNRIVVILALFIFLSSFSGDTPKAVKVFPKPDKEKIPNMLFYVQRTFNTNTIIYELNLNSKGELNTQDPFNIHWINYASDNSSEGLNYIQRKYAYGLEVKLLDAEKQTYVFNFVSYKKKKLYLMKSPIDNKYHVFSDINNRLVALDRIFIQIEGGSFWVPHIVYIEVSGTDIAKNNEPVVERVIPKQ
jgi:hypothetical protein